MDDEDLQKIKILPTDQEKEFGSVWRKWITRKISQEKSGTAKPKWNNLLDSHLRRKLKRSEGETKSSDLNKTEDTGIKNDPDLNHQGKMADNHELPVDDGDEEMNHQDYIHEELRGKLPNPIKVLPKFQRTFSLPEGVKDSSIPDTKNIYVPSIDYCPYLDKPPRKKQQQSDTKQKDDLENKNVENKTKDDVIVIPEKDYCPYLDKPPRPQIKQNDFEVRKWILKNETGDDEELQVFFQDNTSLKERRTSAGKSLVSPRSNSLPEIKFNHDKPPKWMELVDMKLGFGDFPDDIDSIVESNVETEITEVKTNQKNEDIEPDVFKVWFYKHTHMILR